MSTRDHVPPLVALIDRVGRAGRPGRELAVRLDVARSISLQRAWRRFRQTARSARDAGAALSLEPAYQTIWRDAAREVGAELVELPGGFIEMRANGAWTRVWRHWVMLDDAVTLRYALQKGLVQERLSASGLPVPEHLEFDGSNLAAAEEFLARGPIPCVVKPAGESGGSGVSCGVRTRSNLVRARLRAWRLDNRLLIERQIAGDNYRFMFLDGVLIDAIRRRPPRVTGDGRSTIEELIEAENARRVQRQQEVLFWRLDIDLDCIFTLEAAGLTVASVLPAGKTIAVKTVVNQNTIDDNETVREPIADALVAEARAAAQLIGVRLAGIDLVTTDLSRSLADSGGAILEVNGTPGLHYHYEVTEVADATRVAVPILKALLDPARAPGAQASTQRT
jgi:D-alanine-D-alanine ligase-like ATP-grasp enzyme